MLNAFAGQITQFQASVGSTLSVLAFLYAFWYLGKAWPAVATAGGGFFSMQQANSSSHVLNGWSLFLSTPKLHDALWLAALVCI